MNKLDRLLVFFAGLGVWALVVTNIFSPHYINAHEDGHGHGTYEIYFLDSQIESVIEDCHVYGEAYDGEVNAHISC